MDTQPASSVWIVPDFCEIWEFLPYNVGLHGVAAQPGTLKLLGYSHNVLGDFFSVFFDSTQLVFFQVWIQNVCYRDSQEQQEML